MTGCADHRREWRDFLFCWYSEGLAGNIRAIHVGGIKDVLEVPLVQAVELLMMQERVKFASSCSLTDSKQALDIVYGNLEWFRKRILLRPQEISNSPEVVRRLGIISINTRIEVDIFGNVNSTHVMGRQMMNGIGGSGDFTRNAYISAAKGGKVSTIVPLVSHVDHSEHSVQIVITEWGVADLRGRSPYERANLIIENCAHPEFRETLKAYMRMVESGHTPQTLSAAFAFHEQFLKTGDMRWVDWAKIG